MSNILVCDSDDLMRVLLREWLVDAGYDVMLAPTPPARAGPAPNLIIVDVNMPRCDCVPTVRRLRALFPATPVIAMSARFCVGAGDATAALDSMGVRGILAKPFTRNCLLDTVRAAMSVAG